MYTVNSEEAKFAAKYLATDENGVQRKLQQFTQTMTGDYQ